MWSLSSVIIKSTNCAPLCNGKIFISLFSISGIRKKAAENIQLDVLHPEFRLLKRSRSFDRSSWTLDNLHARTEGFSGKAKLLYEEIFSWLRFLSYFKNSEAYYISYKLLGLLVNLNFQLFLLTKFPSEGIGVGFSCTNSAIDW
jgi:hypothetical protein